MWKAQHSRNDTLLRDVEFEIERKLIVLYYFITKFN